jgi:hypothetical protein
MQTTDLSLTQLAILAAIVDYVDIGTDLLRAFVPQPADVSAWFDDLQVLLDRGFVIRVAGSGQYLYRATTAGVDYLRAHLHPHGRSMRNAS